MAKKTVKTGKQASAVQDDRLVKGVRLDLSPADHKRLEDGSKKLGLTMASYARMAVLNASGPMKGVDNDSRPDSGNGARDAVQGFRHQARRRDGVPYTPPRICLRSASLCTPGRSSSTWIPRTVTATGSGGSISAW